MKLTLLFSLVASMAFASAQITADEAVFKDSFIKAAKANDIVSVMSLLCLDSITPEWRQKVEGHFEFIISEFQIHDPESVSFTPYTDPQPLPIKYGDTFLAPNLTISTICEFKWPEGNQREFYYPVTGLYLGKKDGNLMVAIMTPQTKTEQGDPPNP